MRSKGETIPGLRNLMRRHDSILGGSMLFQLARHPIDRASRHGIIDRLRRSHFERVIPTWQAELEACDATWGHGVPVGDIVRYSDD